MADISELERRITAALERAAQAMESLGPVSDGAANGDLAAELEAERAANAQLEERVRAIREKQETTVAGLEAEVRRLQEALAARDAEVGTIRSVNDELRASNRQLREANAGGLADASIVDAALRSENRALRARREADRAEIDAILATLDPVLKEA